MKIDVTGGDRRKVFEVAFQDRIARHTQVIQRSLHVSCILLSNGPFPLESLSYPKIRQVSWQITKLFLFMRQYSEPESTSCRHRVFSAGQARMKETYQQAAIAAIPPARIQTQSGQLCAHRQPMPEKRVAFVSSSGLHREFWPAYWRSGTLSLPRTRPHSCQQTWKPGWAWLARLF